MIRKQLLTYSTIFYNQTLVRGQQGFKWFDTAAEVGLWKKNMLQMHWYGHSVFKYY